MEKNVQDRLHELEQKLSLQGIQILRLEHRVKELEDRNKLLSERLWKPLVGEQHDPAR